MAMIINVSQYNSVPDIEPPVGSTAVAIAQFPGPLIEAENVALDGSGEIEWAASARFAMVTIIDSGVVYVRSSSSNSPALAVGAGQAIIDQSPVLREGAHTYLLLREHA